MGGENWSFLIIAGIFFTVWFFSGTTQRTSPYGISAGIGHSVSGSYRMGTTDAFSARKRGAECRINHQLTGHSLFTVNYAKHIFSSETRWGFLERNVSRANAAKWINENLPESVRIGFTERQLAYLIEVPAFMIHPDIQAVIDTRPVTGTKNGLLIKPEDKD